MQPKKTTVKIFCKARSDFALTIKDGRVCLAPSDILDKKQQWYKIEQSYKVDNKNISGFALVNKATGQALHPDAKSLHPDAKSEAPVQLTLKYPNNKDKYLLWIEGMTVIKGFRRVKMACDEMWNLEASGEGFVENGTKVIVSRRKEERKDTPFWNIEKYSPPYKINCKSEPGLYLSIRDDRVVLAPANPFDKSQRWYKDNKYSERVKDEDGLKCFALVNKATGKAIKHSTTSNKEVIYKTCVEDYSLPEKPEVHVRHAYKEAYKVTRVSMVTCEPTGVIDESLLWTELSLDGDVLRTIKDGDFRTIRMVNSPHLVWHAKDDKVHDRTPLVNRAKNGGENQQWNIEKYVWK